MNWLRRLLAGTSVTWHPTAGLTLADILGDLHTSPGDIAQLARIAAPVVVPDRIPEWMLVPDTVPVEWL